MSKETYEPESPFFPALIATLQRAIDNVNSLCYRDIVKWTGGYTLELGAGTDAGGVVLPDMADTISNEDFKKMLELLVVETEPDN